LATRRTTFDKRERERAKQAKAAAKRARRQDKSDDDPEDAAPTATEHLSTEVLLQRLETLHEDYDAGRISFEDFDAQKADLVDRLAICLSE
jgi:gas vesicle protein GvpG